LKKKCQKGTSIAEETNLNFKKQNENGRLLGEQENWCEKVI